MTDAQPVAGRGRIISFYSFKGGVGRTMALANVAFLAAMNGKRVLVMDWDLEAPGLSYYFRGMQEAGAAKALRAAPGVLDLVWNWSSALREMKSMGEAQSLLRRYESGEPFRALTRSLLPDFEDPETGVLHHIGAGSALIATPELVAYEDALARFDWSAFFSEEAGGILLQTLRSWAKSEYDYIFLDSRTGFADVAGICTMQIPDQVALCYIYNRQNIDGIAQVAGAIRSRRGTDIELRAVPMRVSRENTSEEADARGRARKELMRKGGFTVEAVETDQKALAIKQAPNVPFYETIALIASERPRSDPLALDYLNLACQLLGTNFEMPVLFEGWVERVRRRLQSRQAAPDYLLGLRSKDPERAIDEVTQLLENALDEGVDGDGDEEYLQALVTTAMHLGRDADSSLDVETLMGLTLDLLRNLLSRDSDKWGRQFADFLQAYIEQMASVLDDDDLLLLMDEEDALLAGFDGNDVHLRRIENRRRAARTHLYLGHDESAAQVTADLARMVGDLAGRLSGDARLDLLAAEMDIALLRGDISVRGDRLEAARRLYEAGLDLPGAEESNSRLDLARLRFDLHVRLARLPENVISASDAAGHAMEALEWATASNALVLYAVELGEAVLRTKDAAMLEAFVRKAFRPSDRRGSQFIPYHGRNLRAAAGFIHFIRAAVPILGDSEAGHSTLVALLELLVPIVEMLGRRRFGSLAPIKVDVRRELHRLIKALDSDSTETGDYVDRLRVLAERLPVSRSRPRE